MKTFSELCGKGGGDCCYRTSAPPTAQYKRFSSCLWIRVDVNYQNLKNVHKLVAEITSHNMNSRLLICGRQSSVRDKGKSVENSSIIENPFEVVPD